MKIAIYSRLLEEDKRSDVQFFFDELARQKIAAAVFLPFYEEIKDRINLPAIHQLFIYPMILQMI
jgi:hypothetical protein